MTHQTHYRSYRRAIDYQELKRLQDANVLFLDRRRSRPLWFAGRFLTARDLNRETEYFLSRQADLSVATGTGVIEGLMVEEISGRADELRIQQGFGVTRNGERVVLSRDTTVDLGDLSFIQSINQRVGWSRRPLPSWRNQSGVFVIALRAFEYTANKIASYPTDIDGERSFNDGDVIEATAIVALPYEQPSGIDANGIAQRSEIADKVFTRQSALELPDDTLPLAMVEIRRGHIQWIDNYLVRQDMGSSFSDVLGFGIVPRPLRHAHFKQYANTLNDVIEDRISGGRSLRFAATEHFLSLPSSGQLPSAAVDMSAHTQFYFPDSMDVEISLIPDDEVGTLVEESLLLPPIDLVADEATMAATSVLILAPVKRSEFHSLARLLNQKPPPVKMKRRVVISKVTPRMAIKGLYSKLSIYEPPQEEDSDVMAHASWGSLISQLDRLWYVRRRNIAYKEEMEGKPIHVMTNESQDETDMRNQLEEWSLYNRFTHLKTRASAAADLEMVRMLTIPKIMNNELLTRGLMDEYQETNKGERLDQLSVVSINRRYLEDPNMGIGLEEIRGEIMALSDAQFRKLGKSRRFPEIDYIVQRLDGNALTQFRDTLITAVKTTSNTETDIANFVDSAKESLLT